MPVLTSFHLLPTVDLLKRYAFISRTAIWVVFISTQWVKRMMKFSVWSSFEVQHKYLFIIFSELAESLFPAIVFLGKDVFCMYASCKGPQFLWGTSICCWSININYVSKIIKSKCVFYGQCREHTSSNRQGDGFIWSSKREEDTGEY